MNVIPCTPNVFDYSILLPSSASFEVLFSCNGTTYTSPTFDNVNSALTWASATFPSIGNWSLVGNVLYLIGSSCSEGGLAYSTAAGVYGCTDPAAVNYNPLATIDDGSCSVAPSTVLGCTNPSATNYNPLANEDDGSCTFANNDLVFNTAAAQAIQTKIGSNIFETDVSQFSGWIAKSQEINFQMYYYTPIKYSGVMNESTAALVNAFLSAVGVPVGLIYWVRTDSIAAGFPTYLDWLIARYNPEFIQLDQESLSTGMSNATYIARSRQVTGRTAIPCSWDCGLMYRNNAATINRNIALSTEAAPPTIGRQYMQISPDICVFDPSDQNYNVRLLNNYFNVLLPQYTADFFTTFPNLTTINIAQWHNEDYGTSDKLTDATSNFAIGMMALFILANTSSYIYLIWMQHSNLVKGGVKPEFTAIKRIVPAFRFLNVMPVAIPISGCRALGFNDGANSFGLLIVNQRSVESTILVSDVVIPSKTVSGNFARDTGYADTWASTQQNKIVSEANITIRKNSVSMITFTTT